MTKAFAVTAHRFHPNIHKELGVASDVVMAFLIVHLRCDGSGVGGQTFMSLMNKTHFKQLFQNWWNSILLQGDRMLLAMPETREQCDDHDNVVLCVARMAMDVCKGVETTTTAAWRGFVISHFAAWIRDNSLFAIASVQDEVDRFRNGVWVAAAFGEWLQTCKRATEFEGSDRDILRMWKKKKKEETQPLVP